MKKNKRTNLAAILICLACTIPVTGCSKKTVINESPSQTEATKQNHETKIISLIEQGQQSFLYPMEDGYSYPVKVLKPVFIETMPLKIKVRLLYQQRDVAVVVKKLQAAHIFSAESAPVVEAKLKDKWQAITDENIRVKTINGENK